MPEFNEFKNYRQVQTVVNGRIDLQIRPGQPEQGNGRAGPIFLHVDKSAGELDEALVKRTVRSLAIWQPKIFEDIVSFVKLLAVEAIEKAKIVSRQMVALKLFNPPGYVFALFAHQ